MFQIPKATSFVCVFKAYLSSDHVTEATGKTIAITISKAGGAFGNLNAGATNATEISSGWYKVTLDTTDTGTLGVIAIRGTAATIDDYGDRFFVVNATNGGLTALPDVASGSAGAVIVSGTGTAALSVSSGQVILQSGTGTGQLSFTSGILKVDVDTIKTNPVVNAGTITFPTTATLASTTNITAGTMTTTTNLTNLPSIPANWLTAAGINAGALNGKGDWLLSSGYTAPTNLTAAQIATGIWQDTTAGDFTTAASVGKSIMNGVALGTGLTIASVSGAVGSVTATVNADIKKVNAVTVNGDGAGTPWGP